MNDRIQVFTPEGKFVKEAWVAERTLGDGSTWDIAFSNDPQQKFIYLADGQDEKIWILDRQTLEILTSFGDGGNMPGQFYAVHSIADRLEGQHLHDRNLRRPPPAALPLQGDAERHEGRRPGDRLADEVDKVTRSMADGSGLMAYG